MSHQKDFKINSASKDFLQRHKTVFDQLTTLEKNITNDSPIKISDHSMEIDETIPTKRNKNNRSYSKQFRGKESIFKRPLDPGPKNFLHKIPDFKKNPHKWTKYTLGDVRDEDISDKGNTNAALSFLKELEKRRTKEEEAMDDDNSNKIVFKKRTNVKPKDDGKNTTVTFKSSKMVMPEYIVGEKVRKEKKVRSKPDKVKEIQLNHLLDAEDE